MSSQEADVLRCWRCRKHIANSICLAKCHRKEISETSQSSTDAQESCSVWHVNLEAIPEWVKCVIEKAQWTVGKLHCPFCEVCLGGFNFVCKTKCSCGQLVNIHFCKSQTDYQPASFVKLAKSSGRHLALLKIQSGFSKDTCHEMAASTLKIKSQRLSYMARNNNGAGRLTEALCLEERAPRLEMTSKKLPLKALNQNRNFSASCPMNDGCTVKPFHRRALSLDLNIRERIILPPELYGTCSMATVYHGQNENPPIYTQCGLQLESSRKHDSSFEELHSSSAEKLQKTFRVASFTTLLHRETESEYDFEATGQSSGSAIPDGSPFVMNLSLAANAAEEEQYITPVGLVKPTSIFFNQKLSKRDRSKLKSLRRKQRQERWLQKQ
ncbi:RN180 ligase, partial [Galbula dea]|nr:RN180 ligase [Galbula dea]